MKFLKLKSILFSLIALGAISAFLVSCEREVVIDQVKEYTGEDYFKAIFLMEGELAEKIPSYEHFILQKEKSIAENPALVREYEQFNKNLEVAVNKIDPDFTIDLKNAIESSDASKVELAIKRGGSIFKLANMEGTIKIDPAVESALSDIKNNEYDFTTEEGVNAFAKDAQNLFTNSKNLNLAGDEYVEGRIFIVGPVAVAVAVAAVGVVVWKGYWFKTADTNDFSESDLYAQENLIQEIIKLNTNY